MSSKSIDIVISIPEIQIALRAILTHHELLNTLLVSKQWYTAFLPAYWHTLYVSTPMGDHESELLKPVGHLVRDLDLMHYTIIERFVTYCHRLHTLKVATFGVPANILTRYWPLLIQLIQQNTGLTALHLNIRSMLVGKSVLSAFEAAPKLTSAMLVCSMPIDTYLILNILEQCPLLEYLKVSSNYPIIVRSADEFYATRQGRPMMYPHLRQLDVDNDHKSDIVWNLLLPIWRRAPRIEIFDVMLDWISGRECVGELQSLMHSSCPHVQDLSVEMTEASPTPEGGAAADSTWVDTDLAALLTPPLPPAADPPISSALRQQQLVSAPTTLTRLKTIFCSVGVLTARALSTYHASTLVSLIMVGGPGDRSWRLSSEAIASILTSCHKLKVLCLRRGYAFSVQDPIFSCSLDARVAIRKPWVCLGLETLEVHVSGICRPRPEASISTSAFASTPAAMASNHTSNSHHDIEAIGKEEENTDHFDSAEHREQCHNIQRQVFQQLGKLTKLRLLLLGDQRLQIPAHERSRFQAFGHFDCLDFSLALDSGDERNKGAGGLRYLAHLNELEILDVAGLLHNIGIEEVTWMLSYWPKLKKIHGLAHGYNGGNIQAMQFLRNNYPSVALR